MYLAQNIACPLVYLKEEIYSTYSLIEYFRAILYSFAYSFYILYFIFYIVLQVIFRRLLQIQE